MSEIYTIFDQENDIVTNINRRVTTGLWTGDTGSLSTFYTSSTQSGSSGNWYYDVYNSDPSIETTAAVQFSVTYGHRYGYGSPTPDESNNSKHPTKAIWGQLKNLLLSPTDNQFTFGNYSSNDFLAIVFERNRLKQRIDAGNWELHLNGAGGTIKLIDDSGNTQDSYTSAGGSYYNIVSGSISTGTPVIKTAASNEPSGSYGIFYPDKGILLLNPLALKSGSVQALDSYTTSSTSYNNNHGSLFDSIVDGAYFAARNEESINSTHYFVRVKNKQYNYSNNPSFITGSDGLVKHPSFANDPQTYITTVGLYNDNSELVAVAKISKPIVKSFDREALIKVKIDY